MKTLIDLKIGEYMFLNENDWEVRLDKETWFTCKTHYEALILSKLIQLELLSDLI